jgi:diguanylate cyclase (GGDEF)-like protein
MVVAFGLIRSGWSRRMKDPALTLPQMIYAVLCDAVAFMIFGPPHAATLLVLVLVLMFGMFGLSQGQIRAVVAFAVMVFGAGMAVMAQADPVGFPPRVELAYFATLVIVSGGVLVLNKRLGLMRARMLRQRHELSQAVQRIGEMASRDELTGLANRRQVQESLNAARDASAHGGSGWCAALVDVDRFKNVNDHHGHAVGDEVLRALARSGSGQVRKQDLLGRWGGEEFVLLLRDASLETAVAAVDRWRQALSAQPIAVGELQVPVTFSAGVAAYREGESVEQVLARADEALYRAKNAGRNRVEAAADAARAH